MKRGHDVISDRKYLLHIDKIYTYITTTLTISQPSNLLFQQIFLQSKKYIQIWLVKYLLLYLNKKYEITSFNNCMVYFMFIYCLGSQLHHVVMDRKSNISLFNCFQLQLHNVKR